MNKINFFICFVILKTLVVTQWVLANRYGIASEFPNRTFSTQSPYRTVNSLLPSLNIREILGTQKKSGFLDTKKDPKQDRSSFRPSNIGNKMVQSQQVSADTKPDIYPENRLLKNKLDAQFLRSVEWTALKKIVLPLIKPSINRAVSYIVDTMNHQEYFQSRSVEQNTLPPLLRVHQRPVSSFSVAPKMSTDHYQTEKKTRNQSDLILYLMTALASWRVNERYFTYPPRGNEAFYRYANKVVALIESLLNQDLSSVKGTWVLHILHNLRQCAHDFPNNTVMFMKRLHMINVWVRHNKTAPTQDSLIKNKQKAL